MWVNSLKEMCRTEWKHAWDLLEVFAHHLNAAEGPLNNLVEVACDVGKTLPCDACAAEWARTVTPANLPSGEDARAWHDSIFDMRAAWRVRRKLPTHLYHPPQFPDTIHCGHAYERDEAKTAWAPPYWAFFHRLPMNPSLFKTHKKRLWTWNLIMRVASTVPCERCANHWSCTVPLIAEDIDAVMASPISLFTFLYDVHSLWNAKLGKPWFSWKDALAKYGYPGSGHYDRALLVCLI